MKNESKKAEKHPSARTDKKKYTFLFEKITDALEALEKKDAESAADILKDVQCRAKEIFANSSHQEDDSLYPDITKRMNLQAIGYFIKEKSTSNRINYGSLSQRNRDADKALDSTLKELLDEKTEKAVYNAAVDYVMEKEEIQFSLGMKIGAKLAILLLGDLEYDY